jgi:hypothetical protein
MSTAKQTQSRSCQSISFRCILILSSYLYLILQVVCGLQVYQQKLYTNFFPLSCMSDAPLSSSSLIWSSPHTTRSTNHEAPHYVTFFIFCHFPSQSKYSPHPVSQSASITVIPIFSHSFAPAPLNNMQNCSFGYLNVHIFRYHIGWQTKQSAIHTTTQTHKQATQPSLYTFYVSITMFCAVSCFW